MSDIMNFCRLALRKDVINNRSRFSFRNIIALIHARHAGNFNRIRNASDLEGYGIDPASIDPGVLEDALFTVPQLIEKYKYPVEVHHIRTSDGYLLEMHRIPKSGGVPILLQHGILDSSAAWVLMGPKQSAAYYFSDLGYDVWLGNVRGNRYSRSHIKYNTKEKQFWDFSFHEMGLFDLPAMIDYIVEETQISEIHYIGHSQGTTAFWVMCSERPVYCGKIKSMNALAPVALLNNAKSPVLRVVVMFLNQIESVFKLLGVYEFLPKNDFLTLAGQVLCEKEAVTHVLCTNAIFLLAGYNSEQMNMTMLPAILGHFPAGASTKQFVHFGQIFKSKLFRQYDYGWLSNRFKYGSTKSPNYDLSRVKVPVALHYSQNDWLADVADVKHLERHLPNVIESHLISDPKFNHLDFTFGMNSPQLVYERVAKIIGDIENSVI